MRWALVLVVFGVFAVASAQEPAFEVASVKVAEGRANGLGSFVPGEARFNSSALWRIVPSAFGIPIPLWELKVIPGPTIPPDLWRSRRFQIHGKGNPANDARAMLLTLLKERFGMRYHTEVRHVPIYALTVKKPGTLGPRLTETPHNCREFIARGGRRGDVDSPKLGDIEACWPSGSREVGAGTISDLIERVAISATLAERPVIDATGLTGNFMWNVGITHVQGTMDPVFAAFEDQLGLKLEERTGPWEVIVIDDIRMPTPN